MEVRFTFFWILIILSQRCFAVRSMTTLLNHRTTLEYLAYLGYPDMPRTSALQITRPRKTDRRKGKLTRNVLLGYVCGAAGSGKTSVLRAFVGRKFSEAYEPTKRMNSVVSSVDLDGREVYLVVRVNYYDVGCRNTDPWS